MGIVERHIGTLKDALAKLYLEECVGDLGPQELVDMALEAKNFNASHGGFSPANWMLGRQHPLLRTDTVPPNLTVFPTLSCILQGGLKQLRRTNTPMHVHYYASRPTLDPERCNSLNLETSCIT